VRVGVCTPSLSNLGKGGEGGKRKGGEVENVTLAMDGLDSIIWVGFHGAIFSG